MAQNSLIHLSGNHHATLEKSQNDEEENFLAAEEDLASEVSNNILAIPYNPVLEFARHTMEPEQVKLSSDLMQQQTEALEENNLLKSYMFMPADTLRMIQKNMENFSAIQLQMMALTLESWRSLFNMHYRQF